MFFDKAVIVGVAHVDAPHRITSTWIEEQLAPTMRRLGIPAGTLEGLSGIAARRFWDPGLTPSDVATLAAKKVIEATGVDPQRIGALVSTSVCRDWVEPSTACLVQGNLELSPMCLNFDIGNACLGFLNGMSVVGNMLERGQIDYALLVDGEGSRLLIESTIAYLNDTEVDEAEFKANFASLTLGSGAAAMIMARSDLAPDGHHLHGLVSMASTRFNRLCLGENHHMSADTKGLLMAGLELSVKTWALAKKTFEWDTDTLGQFVVHQVSKVHSDKLAQLLRLDPDKVLDTYPEFGNTGPASIPIALSKCLELGRIERGQRIALMGIGSGMNTSVADVTW